MNILIKGKHENFVIPFKSHERDFCYDCVAVSKKRIDDKTGLILANSIATGDEDYRGEYAVVFYHFDKSLPEYEIGDKVFQLKVGFAPIIKFTETKDLTITDRGAGGFGSTGK